MRITRRQLRRIIREAVSDEMDWASSTVGRGLVGQAGRSTSDQIKDEVAYELGVDPEDVEIVKLKGVNGWPVIRIHGPGAMAAQKRYYAMGD